MTAKHGPTSEVEFTTTEGTWMNLDVSPDGKEIVFDFLGDIYIMPITDLAYGVTTMHNPSANTESVFSMAEMVAAGKMVGPRMYSTGTILYGANDDFKAVINNFDDARPHWRRMKAPGAFSVKSYNQPRRNQRQRVIQAARELQMMVVPEGGSFFHHKPEHGSRQPHRHRASDSGDAGLQRRAQALGREPNRLHADFDGRLWRH